MASVDNQPVADISHLVRKKRVRKELKITALAVSGWRVKLYYRRHHEELNSIACGAVLADAHRCVVVIK